VTWAELIRQLREHGFEELRTAKGSHRQFWHPTSRKIVTVTVHTKKEVGTGLANRILKDAGIKTSRGQS
jgi:predicted RNA binding protein YcfA (HicA-like mRNA interferase family)